MPRSEFPVEHVSPLAAPGPDRDRPRPEQAASIDPVLATPIGLALPEPNPSVKKFNLVPPEVIQRAFERGVAKKAFVAAALVAVALVGASAWRFLEVRNAQNCVSSLQESVTQLNAQIPTYDKVVAISNELRLAKNQVTQLSATAVDWSAVVSQLGQRIPASLESPRLQVRARRLGPLPLRQLPPARAHGPAPAGSIGSLQLSISGNFPSSAHFDPVAQWIDNLTASPDVQPSRSERLSVTHRMVRVPPLRFNRRCGSRPAPT